MNRPSPLIPFLCLALGAAHPAQESPAALPPPGP